MTITETLAWLRGLDEGATRGPWRLAVPCSGAFDDCANIESGSEDIAVDVDDDNAALIAYVRNVLPQLIGVVEAVPDVLAASVGNDYSCTVPTTTLKTLHDALTALAAAVEKESKYAVPPQGNRA